jgi:hypothetical protein
VHLSFMCHPCRHFEVIIMAGCKYSPHPLDPFSHPDPVGVGYVVTSLRDSQQRRISPLSKGSERVVASRSKLECLVSTLFRAE